MLRWVGSAAVAIATLAGAARADDCSNAQALVDKAVGHYREVGKDRAFADFMTREWMRGDLYVIVSTMDGIFKLHPINPRLVDNPQMPLLRDSNGVLIVQEMIRSGKQAPDGGWAKYTWTNSDTKQLAVKQTWVRVHEDQLFMAGCYP